MLGYVEGLSEWLWKSKLITADAQAAKDASKLALSVFWNGLRNSPSSQTPAVAQHV